MKNFSHLPTKKSPILNHHYYHQLTPSKVEPNKSPSTSNHQFVQRPGNLLFSQPEVMKLADFGCATLAPESITLEEKLWVVRVGLVGVFQGSLGWERCWIGEKMVKKMEKSCGTSCFSGFRWVFVGFFVGARFKFMTVLDIWEVRSFLRVESVCVGRNND